MRHSLPSPVFFLLGQKTIVSRDLNNRGVNSLEMCCVVFCTIPPTRGLSCLNYSQTLLQVASSAINRFVKIWQIRHWAWGGGNCVESPPLLNVHFPSVLLPLSPGFGSKHFASSLVFIFPGANVLNAALKIKLWRRNVCLWEVSMVPLLVNDLRMICHCKMLRMWNMNLTNVV